MQKLQGLSVRDIAATEYVTIGPDAPVSKAAKLIFRGEARDTGYKPFGLMVVDDFSHLMGMISMEDILYHLRPPFMNYELENVPLWEGELEVYLDHFTDLRVEQVMSSPVITVRPQDDLMVVIDRMVKSKIRRLPVVEDEKIIGIVYLSDVFYHVCKNWLKDEPD
jgi:CBS domain-containing protein